MYNNNLFSSCPHSCTVLVVYFLCIIVYCTYHTISTRRPGKQNVIIIVPVTCMLYVTWIHGNERNSMVIFDTIQYKMQTDIQHYSTR